RPGEHCPQRTDGVQQARVFLWRWSLDLNLSDPRPLTQVYIESDISKLIRFIELRVRLNRGPEISIILKELEQRRLRLRNLRFVVQVLIRKVGYLQQPRVSECLHRPWKLQDSDVESRFQNKRHLQTGGIWFE